MHTATHRSFNLAQPGRDAVYGLTNWITAFSDPSATSAIWNTVALGVVRTALALPIALTMTWLIARSDMPGRSIVELLCWLGVFLPVLPLTLGWILLMDPGYGLLNAALQQTAIASGPVFKSIASGASSGSTSPRAPSTTRLCCCCRSSGA